MKALTRKQRLFIHYYCQTWNATQAAESAGYSEKSAGVIGHELLKKPYIQREIDYQLKLIMGEIDVSATSIARELAQVAFGDADHDTTMKYSDKLKALELLGRYHQMFIDRVETVSLDDIYNDITKQPESSPKNAVKH